MSIDKQNLRKKRNTNSISFRRSVSKLFQIVQYKLQTRTLRRNIYTTFFMFVQ